LDIDVVLNACLETYQQGEIQKAVKFREALTKPWVSKLFLNGQEFADVHELSINQSASRTPVYELGSAMTRYISGRQNITGKFLAKVDEEKFFGIGSIHDYSPSSWYIETTVLHADGSVNKTRIMQLMLSMTYQESDKVIFEYIGSHMETASTKVL
jgi:hypothetical protein